ncbi:MAG TPA: T9SS type A sorting domain-containing protein [Candidatus Kapabacteria bacterium]|nr:T9SS type A sorting domain-containing protein [Candidatus Kapabacteria bacterium]
MEKLLMRKLLFCVLIVICLPKANYGQILNAGFETWTGGDPDNWATSNIPGSVTNVSSTTDAHGGSLAARGDVVQFSGTPYPPLLFNTTAANAGSGVDHRVVALTMWIKFHSDSGDVLSIASTLTKQSSTPVGAISIRSATEVSQWSQLSLPYTYLDPLTVPDTMTVIFLISGKTSSTPHVGSWFEVDDLAYSDVHSGIPDQAASSFNVSVFPNPIREQSAIHLSLSESAPVTIAIYDITGREVEKLVSSTYSAGSYMIPFIRSGLSDGMYYLRVIAGSNSATLPLAFVQ